jgi:hypothetical protein
MLKVQQLPHLVMEIGIGKGISGELIFEEIG